ncbi:hypothetical protein VNO80_09798 [Phaseolus coccineus]|uniref:Uncharacterized protein n=1 Tax=Phaseolus coccineus TaxID=3886 RepID=A0AAN9N766_PHACN
MMLSNLRATMDDLRTLGNVFVQRILPLNTTLPEKCQPRSEDGNAPARNVLGAREWKKRTSWVYMLSESTKLIQGLNKNGEEHQNKEKKDWKRDNR